MPFVPNDEPEERREPCRSSEHYPPAHVVIVGRVRWRCPACRREVVLEPGAGQRRVFGLRPEERTAADVILLRTAYAVYGGCCDRFADNQPCDCLARARRCPECAGTGYKTHPENGRRVGVRCPRGCAVRCSVCGDPDCDNPDGQH